MVYLLTQQQRNNMLRSTNKTNACLLENFSDNPTVEWKCTSKVTSVSLVVFQTAAPSWNMVCGNWKLQAGTHAYMHPCDRLGIYASSCSKIVVSLLPWTAQDWTISLVKDWGPSGIEKIKMLDQSRRQLNRIISSAPNCAGKLSPATRVGTQSIHGSWV